MNTNIPSNADPRPAIDKILTHFTRLREHKLDIPKQLKVLMLLSKAPPSMEVMVQVASREAATKNIELSEVCNGMIMSWQNYGQTGSQGNQQQGAVKWQDDQNPQFQQQQQPNQQQQCSEGEWQGGRGCRGKRGGQRNQPANLQQQLQQAPVQAKSQQPPAGPSNQQNFSFAPGPANLGYLTTPAMIPPPPNTMYPTFNKAIDLAHRLGVPTTIETLKTLENTKISKPSRPLKHHYQETHTMRPSSSWGAIQGRVAQVKAAAKEKNNDEVSLDFSGDEVADVPMTIGDFQRNEHYIEQEVVDDFDINVDGIIDLYWQVHSSALLKAATDDIQTELDNIAICTNKLSPFCTSQCECKNSEIQEWMLDSGASFHFSGDINDC